MKFDEKLMKFNENLMKEEASKRLQSTQRARDNKVPLELR